MIKLIPPKGKYTYYFDVDCTLVFESHPDEKDVVLLQDERGWFHYEIHKPHVEEFKRLRDEGHMMLVWTGHNEGGKWAEQVVVALGLDGDNVAVVAKPDRFYDDVPAEEVLHPSQRKYLSRKA